MSALTLAACNGLPCLWYADANIDAKVAITHEYNAKARITDESFIDIDEA